MDTMARKMAGISSDDQRNKESNECEISREIVRLKADLAELVQTAGNIARAGAADVQNAATERTDHLRDAIKSNPMQATLVGAGIGFIFGLILSR